VQFGTATSGGQLLIPSKYERQARQLCCNNKNELQTYNDTRLVSCPIEVGIVGGVLPPFSPLTQSIRVTSLPRLIHSVKVKQVASMASIAHESTKAQSPKQAIAFIARAQIDLTSSFLRSLDCCLKDEKCARLLEFEWFVCGPRRPPVPVI
jgi:hypothetical protein